MASWKGLGMVTLLGLLAACGEVKGNDGGDDTEDDGDDSDDAADDGEPAAFTIAAAPGRVLLRQGGSADVDVTIERETGFEDAVVVEVADLPGGVTATALTIAAGESAGTVTLSAAANSIQGALDVAVTGTAGDVVESASTRLLVAGEPGTLDLSFAEAGKLVTRAGRAFVSGRGMALQPDGKIIATGSGANEAVTVRLTEDGALDDSFGEGGVVATNLGSNCGGLVVTLPNPDRILVSGWGQGTMGMTDMALFAYTAAGEPDDDFGIGGTVLSDFGGDFGEVHQLLVRDEGALLAIGALFPGGLRVARYTSTGVRDETFNIVEPTLLPDTALLDAEGRIVIGGSVSNATSDFGIARYLASGAPDADFSGGLVSTSFTADSADQVHGLLALADDKLLLVGTTTTPDGKVLALARFDGAGVLDGTFGAGGHVTTAIPMDSQAPNAAVQDADGRILIAGFTRPPATRFPAVARLAPDGTPDPTFGDAGFVTVDFGVGDGTQTGTWGVATDADGRIVISGAAGPNNTVAIVVARLWP